MKKWVPALILFAVLIGGGAILGRASCASPNLERVQTGIVKTSRNAEVATAVLTARHTLDQFVFRFLHPKPGDKGFSVLGDFKTSQGPEHIWVHLDSVEKGIFLGRLAQEPMEIAGKHKGDPVALSKGEISDWGYKTADGQTQGGFTLKALPGG